jgi:hypothetical protein
VQSVAEQGCRKACSGPLAGSDPKVEQRFQAEAREHRSVADLSAALSGDEVCRDGWFDQRCDKRCNGGGEAVKDDECALLGGAECHAGEEGELGPAQAAQCGEWVGEAFAVCFACTLQALGDDLPLAFDGRRIGAGAKSDDLVDSEAQQSGGQCGGDSGVTDPDLAERNEAPAGRVASNEDSPVDQLSHGVLAERVIVDEVSGARAGVDHRERQSGAVGGNRAERASGTCGVEDVVGGGRGVCAHAEFSHWMPSDGEDEGAAGEITMTERDGPVHGSVEHAE